MKTARIIAAMAAALMALAGCEGELKEKEFSVQTLQQSVSMAYGSTAFINFTASGASGDVSASLTSDAVSIRTQGYSRSTGEGSVTIEAKTNVDTTLTVPVTFTDGRSNVSKDISVTVTRTPGTPSVTIVTGSITVWPNRCGKTTSVDFRVTGDTWAEVKAEATDAETAVAYDRKTGSGTVTLTALKDERDAAGYTLTVEATTTAGTGKESASFDMAYLKAAADVQSLDSEGGTVSIAVESNVEWSYEANDTLGVTRSGAELTVNVPANATGKARTLGIRLKDGEGLLEPVTVDIKQDKGWTDYECLMALYNALNGPNWKDEGSWDQWIHNWGKTTDLSKWAGVKVIPGTNDVDDVTIGGQKEITGEIPEAFCHMQHLEWLCLSGTGIYGRLPDNLDSCPELRNIHVSGCEMSGNLEDYRGLEKCIKSRKMGSICIFDCLLTGSLPDWLADINDSCAQLDFQLNHLSGQVPEKLLSKTCFLPENFMQKDSYAVWAGERPSNVKWVTDHWEWTGENPYQKYFTWNELHQYWEWTGEKFY